MANVLKERVKIGPFRFKFVEANLNPGSQDSHHYGLTEFHEATCYIHSPQDIEIKRETYLHELLHVVMMATGLSEHFSEEEEEKFIQALSPTLLDTLQSNPEFTAFVLGYEND